MSRIGKAPIVLPTNVTVEVSDSNYVTVTGPLGTLKQDVDSVITVEISELEGKQVISLKRTSEEKSVKAKHGLYRALIANMVEGVTKGYEKVLEINGVGYKAQKQGNKLVMQLGLSHPVEVEDEEGITIECVSLTEIKVSGIDKQKVGQMAAKIKALRPVEPYHGYGIRYKGERVIRKAGKAAGKGKK